MSQQTRNLIQRTPRAKISFKKIFSHFKKKFFGVGGSTPSIGKSVKWLKNCRNHLNRRVTSSRRHVEWKFHFWTFFPIFKTIFRSTPSIGWKCQTAEKSSQIEARRLELKNEKENSNFITKEERKIIIKKNTRNAAGPESRSGCSRGWKQLIRFPPLHTDTHGHRAAAAWSDRQTADPIKKEKISKWPTNKRRVEADWSVFSFF